MTEKQTRFKAAIMFTDLAGYTALTERDSSAALDLVQMAVNCTKPFYWMRIRLLSNTILNWQIDL